MARSIKVWVARDEKINPVIKSTGVFFSKPFINKEGTYFVIGMHMTHRGYRIKRIGFKPGECRAGTIVLED